MLSIYLEGSNPDQSVEQVFLAPTDKEVKVFARTIIDPKKRNLWKGIQLSQVSNSIATIDPVAVPMTDRDITNAVMDRVSDIAEKNQRASLKLVRTDKGITLSNLASDIHNKLVKGDSSLNDYILDPRYKNPINLNPIGNPVSNPVTPTPIDNNAVMAMASIPDSKWHTEYISRKVTGELSEFQIYDVAMRNHENILIEGHAGSGKTISVLAYASMRGYRYYNVSSHIGLEPSQLFGKWIPTPEGNFVWQDGAVTDLVRHGGVLLLNEINFMPERITTILFGLLDSRREIQLMDNKGEIIKAHNELLVIGDMNPNYRGTRPMNQAWKDRFHHVLEFPYSPEVESKIVKSKVLIELANQLRAEFDKGALDTPISTRKLVAFMNNSKTLGLDYAIYCFCNSFADTERQAVNLVFDTYKENLTSELSTGVEVK